MATFTTYDVVGAAEDVQDVISNISPTDTPMYTAIRPPKVSARIYQYQQDTLANAADNKAVEGADPSMATLTATTMKSGNTQILTKAFQVSATADAIRTYGRAKETAYQLGKALKELKRDIEFAYVGQDNAAVTGNNSGPVAREMDSASQLIHSGNTIDAGSNATDPLTEAKLLDAHEAAYTAGGDPTLFMIKPSDSEIVAGFTGASGRNRTFNDENQTLDKRCQHYGQPIWHVAGGSEPYSDVHTCVLARSQRCGVQQYCVQPHAHCLQRQAIATSTS